MARFSFLALALAFTATTFAVALPPPPVGCRRMSGHVVCERSVSLPAPESLSPSLSPSPSPSPSPSLPSDCHRIGGHVICERPFSAAPESPSPSPSPTIPLSAEELLLIINAMPGPVILDALAHPTKPQPTPAPEYINGLYRSDWEEKERAWREDGIIVDFLPANREEEDDEKEVQKRELGDCKPWSWGC